MPSSHPTEDILVAYAGGQLDRGWRVLLEAHFTYCEACARQVAGFEAPGARWLAEAPDAHLPEKLWEGIETQLEDSPEDELATTPLPEAARAELEPRTQQRRWLKFPFSSVRSTRLWADRQAEVELLLVRIDPGQIFPEHTHLGPEQVQILTGGYTDHVGHFQAGDFTPYPTATSHAPRIDRDEPCWIITRIEKGVLFSGWRGWLTRFVR